MDAARWQRGRTPLLSPPDNYEERKTLAVTGPPNDSCHPGIRTSCANASKSVPDRFVFEYFLFDCMDATTKGWSMDRGRATPGAVAEAEQKKVFRFRVRELD